MEPASEPVVFISHRSIDKGIADTSMFFPSFLFFTQIPSQIEYEIISKHSPNVYTGIIVITDY